jgi:hypothetical protein
MTARVLARRQGELGTGEVGEEMVATPTTVIAGR